LWKNFKNEPKNMFLKLPQNTEKIKWTKHSKMKMRQYRFSEKRVLRILRKPDRVEEGIALGTTAAMQITGTKKHPTEAWMMYEILKKPPKESKHPTGQAKGIRIISTWRYPGRTPTGKLPEIPEDTLRELDNILKNE
jgi:hypothetical protein